MSRTGRWLAYGDSEGLFVYDLTPDGKTRHELKLIGHDGSATAAAFSSNEEWLVTADWEDRSVRLWNLQAFDAEGEPSRVELHLAEVRDIAFTGNNEVVTIDSNGVASVVTLQGQRWTEKQRLDPQTSVSQQHTRVAASMDGVYIVTANSAQLEVWKRESSGSFQLQQTIKLPQNVYVDDLAVSRNKSQILNQTRE
jgi:WD40 repeat protein